MTAEALRRRISGVGSAWWATIKTGRRGCREVSASIRSEQRSPALRRLPRFLVSDAAAKGAAGMQDMSTWREWPSR